MKTALRLYLLLSVFAAASAAVLVSSDLTKAADSSAVTATVTVQNISVSVADGSVAYGTLALNTSKSTRSDDLNDAQTATNDGNVTANLNIRGQDSVAWTLESAVGPDQYKHDFCITDCNTSPTWVPLDTENQSLAASVATSGSQVFHLRITTPTTSSSYTQQTVSVTVQATI